MLPISTLSYSFHLGNDKNKSYRARKLANQSKTGTTSYNNNAIQNAQGLSKVGHHNLRMYDNKQEEISILIGSTDLMSDVKQLYIKEFEQAKIEYNKKQTRNDRKIDDYFTHISNNAKTDLACEIIIELGDYKYWSDKTKQERYKMKEVFIEQLQDLNTVVPAFKIANAVVHFDEKSPHLHIVGVPVKEGGKNGMRKQVGKTTIFTKESLEVIQDKMRTFCIDSFNRVYHTDKQLKPKEKGRNIDLTVEEMTYYQEFKKQYEKSKNHLEKINAKTKTLNDSTKEVKKVLENLKTPIFKSNTLTITKEQKETIENYLQSVNSTTKEISKINKLTISLENVETEIHELNKTIQKKDTEIKSLNKKLDNSKEEIELQVINNNNLRKENSYLKHQINKLQDTIDHLKDKWNHFIHFIKNKLFSWSEKEEIYQKIYDDLKEYDILDKQDCEKIKDNSQELRM